MASNDDQLDAEDFEDGESGSTGGKKWLIIVILLVLLLAGGGAAAYFLLFAGSSEEAEAAADPVAATQPAAHGDGAANPAVGADGAVIGAPVYYEMPEFLVNLSTANKKPSFLKMKVTLELKSEADMKLVESYMPRIVDNFNTYLRELRATDLSGSAGLYRLREEMLMRINQFIAPAKVQNILFKEIVVQ